MVQRARALVDALAISLLMVCAGCAGLAPHALPAPQPPSQPQPQQEPPSGPAGAAATLLDRGRAERASGHYAEAAASIERALRIAPNEPELWLELGEIRLAAGEPEQARTLARKALSLSAGDPEIEARAAELIDGTR
jgi:tetratricopeptide (TPR) repeat protein